MMPDFNQAAAYVSALTGEPVETAKVWWRAIHDTIKDIPAHKFYGTLAQCWNALCDYNNRGYGIFCNINAFAETVTTHNLSDVWYIRTHVIDLDNLATAEMNYARASQSQPYPTFAVNTSPGKFHVYYTVQPYQGNDRYNLLQRKMRQMYDGDKTIIDPTRVLRVPGFLHQKNPQTPHMVTCWSLPAYGQPYQVETLEQAFQHVNVTETVGGRNPLGDAELSAPSLDWLRFGMTHIDPNDLDRGDWISTTAAFKQAGWLHADEQTLFNIWSEWCARYYLNDAGENLKQWNSIRDTEIGWQSIKRRAPILNAYEKFGFSTPAPQVTTLAQPPVPSAGAAASGTTTPAMPETQTSLPDILSEYDCKEWFKDCYFVEREGKIVVPSGRFMNATQFNGRYGGKLFMITPDGKTTDEAWKAATRSIMWTVPKVDHVRFLPLEKSFTIIKDEMGRPGLNIYIPINIKNRPGDITPFLRHMEIMLPVESDRRIIFDYLAHNVKFPGFKIPWAPMIQSAEGVGKGFLLKAMEKIIGSMYVYRPKADELVSSGSTFNAWQRGKLFIIVDEIKVDERRELIEVLKPLISEDRAEVQSKGVDQDMEDNPANWLFFSNYKDAIPIAESGRRYAIFYSAIQSVSDLFARGMDDAYFTNLFNWLNEGGSEIIAHWLLNYPIEKGKIPFRAPDTSSKAEAIKVSRGPIEVAIRHAIEDGLTGFRGGYVSVLAVLARCQQLGIRKPAQATIQRILEQMGYHDAGRAPRMFGQESMVEKPQLYTLLRGMPSDAYGRIQGYE